MADLLRFAQIVRKAWEATDSLRIKNPLFDTVRSLLGRLGGFGGLCRVQPLCVGYRLGTADYRAHSLVANCRMGGPQRAIFRLPAFDVGRRGNRGDVADEFECT